MNLRLQHKPDDESLLQALQEGDSSAYATVYDQYAPIMMQTGHSLTQDENLIQDCIHDVFLKLFTKPYQGNIHNLGSFLIICLRNKLIDEFRRSNYYSDVDIDDKHFCKMVYSAEIDYIDDENHHKAKKTVNNLLLTLTPRQRQVFTLYYIEERKYDEICKIMNMNYHSVRNLVHRGMVKLRSEAV